MLGGNFGSIKSSAFKSALYAASKLNNEANDLMKWQKAAVVQKQGLT
jgi:hypothetical protein